MGLYWLGADLTENVSFTTVWTRQNGKTGIVWELIANGYKRLVEADEKSKQIRRMSYRKTKSQRRYPHTFVMKGFIKG